MSIPKQGMPLSEDDGSLLSQKSPVRLERDFSSKPKANVNRAKFDVPLMPKQLERDFKGPDLTIKHQSVTDGKGKVVFEVSWPESDRRRALVRKEMEIQQKLIMDLFESQIRTRTMLPELGHATPVLETHFEDSPLAIGRFIAVTKLVFDALDPKRDAHEGHNRKPPNILEYFDEAVKWLDRFRPTAEQKKNKMNELV